VLEVAEAVVSAEEAESKEEAVEVLLEGKEAKDKVNSEEAADFKAESAEVVLVINRYLRFTYFLFNIKTIGKVKNHHQ